MGLKWSYGCTSFLIVLCHQSGRSHSPFGCIVVMLALTGFMTESVKFTFLPFFHPSPFLKYRFCSVLLVSVCLWKGLTSAGVGGVRLAQGSQGKLADTLCSVVANQLSCLCSHTPAVNWGSWGTDTLGYPDLAERWERHLRQWWLELLQQDLSESVCLNLRDISILSCRFALSSVCIWSESLRTILS